MQLFVLITVFFGVALLYRAEAATITHGGDSVDIDFVDIGNAGNVADETTGFGAVSYDYQMGTYEVTANQWTTVTSYDSNIATGGVSDAWTGSQPTANVSWYEAAKFANWLTSGDALVGAYLFSDASTFSGVNRQTALETYQTVYVLPTDDEWYKAAYLKSDGSGYTLYPTGDTAPTAGVEANYSSGTSPWSIGTGAAENNATYDMGGNVWEWNESAFAGGEPTGSESRVNRGAHWSRIGTSMQSSARGSASPTTEADYIGFRVAALELQVVPEPSSVGLLVIGAMGFVLRRRRG
ncbi:MAG: SUMF1/EgtB/PvdO family nonheme iron enzyme [Akkermansiaceae bacterium]|jgi:formylglycine-generating enzyme required for sulfatase activity